MAVDAIEVFGGLFTIPRVAGCPGVCRSSVGAFLCGANVVIADKTGVGALGGDVDGIAEWVFAVFGAMGFGGGEGFGAFAGDDGGYAWGEGASFFLRHIAQGQECGRMRVFLGAWRWGRRGARCGRAGDGFGRVDLGAPRTRR